MDEEDKRIRRTLLTAWIGLIAAIIGLIAMLLNLTYTVRNIHLQNTKIESQGVKIESQSNKLKSQDKEIEYLLKKHEIMLKINDPISGDPVGKIINVDGTTTPDELFQYIFIVIRNKAMSEWRIISLAQANSDGIWSAQADIGYIPVGSYVEIKAIVTYRSDLYEVGDIFTVPPDPDQGARSDTIQVRRTQ